MNAPLTEQVTRWLVDWSNGDSAALEKLTPFVYQELHRLAQGFMRRERQGHALQATALVHEAYLRLVGVAQVNWQNRAHFYAVSATLMRRILVDFARTRDQVRRGGGLRQVSLDDTLQIAPDFSAELLDLDTALHELAELNERQGRVVELRFFGGLTEPEIAAVLQVSQRTVNADWSFARAWLQSKLSEPTP